MTANNSCTSESLHILLVEDNPTNQIVARRLLETRGGHRVRVANDGLEALETLENTPFDLVLMDIQMPNMDGLEAAAAIRRGGNPAIDAGIPIIALTAQALPGDRERCLAAGMDDYLVKPLAAQELFETIRTCRRSTGRERKAVEYRREEKEA